MLPALDNFLYRDNYTILVFQNVRFFIGMKDWGVDSLPLADMLYIKNVGQPLFNFTFVAFLKWDDSQKQDI